jgi:hypothetical protein
MMGVLFSAKTVGMVNTLTQQSINVDIAQRDMAHLRPILPIGCR